MEDEQWGDMTNLEHMTLETIPSRFEVFLMNLHFNFCRPSTPLPASILPKDYSRKVSMKFPDVVLCFDQPNLRTNHFMKFMNNSSRETPLLEGLKLFLIQFLILRSIVASIEDLYGTSLHLSADLKGAKEAYQNSLAIVPLPDGFETSLKLASIFVEIGTDEEVFDLLRTR